MGTSYFLVYAVAAFWNIFSYGVSFNFPVILGALFIGDNYFLNPLRLDYIEDLIEYFLLVTLG